MLFLPFLLCSFIMSRKIASSSFPNSKQMKILSEVLISKIFRLGQAVPRVASQAEGNSRNQAASPRNLASFADEYRKLATDCLKVLRVEMQLETVFHLQVCDGSSLCEESGMTMRILSLACKTYENTMVLKRK